MRIRTVCLGLVFLPVWLPIVLMCWAWSRQIQLQTKEGRARARQPHRGSGIARSRGGRASGSRADNNESTRVAAGFAGTAPPCRAPLRRRFRRLQSFQNPRRPRSPPACRRRCHPVRPPPPPPVPRVTKPIDWEAFFGVKLFAWIGGFVLFLGIVFLVKYSFDNNLITPAMRVVIGTVVGLALIVTGWLTATRGYRVSGQSLCATGVLVLYGNIFAAHVYLHLIALVPAFVSMADRDRPRHFSWPSA